MWVGRGMGVGAGVWNAVPLEGDGLKVILIRFIIQIQQKGQSSIMATVPFMLGRVGTASVKTIKPLPKL